MMRTYIGQLENVFLVLMLKIRKGVSCTLIEFLHYKWFV